MRVRRWFTLLAVAWHWCWATGRLLPACPGAGLSGNCTMVADGNDEYIYRVNGETVTISFKDGGYFTMKCEESITLDDDALPRFTEEARVLVISVKLSDCSPPKQSYAQVLRRLGVHAVTVLNIDAAPGVVSRAHLAGLEVTSLVLQELELASDALLDLNVSTLRLDHVKLASSSIADLLPTSLHNLHLTQIGVTTLNSTDLERFPSLNKLTVRENGNLSVQVSGNLSQLALEGAAVWLDPTLPDSLENVTLYGWAGPAPWSSCVGLKKLVISDATIHTLADDWLENCGDLRELSLKYSALDKLPAGLFDKTKLLSALNLSGNNLTELPSGLLIKTQQLNTLDLSDNDLSHDTFERLQTVTTLRELRLDGNRRLGDACTGSNAISFLRELKNLLRLNLSKTGANFICRDFREDMTALQNLDLSENNFTILTHSELGFTSNVTIDLTGNNVTVLRYEWDDYERVARERCAPAAGPALLLSDSLPLACDCALAPGALALRRCPAHLRVLGARCGPPLDAPLARVEPAALLCAVPRAACPAPPHCACARRQRADRRLVLHVACDAAPAWRLTRAAWAAPRTPPALWKLQLANNSIASLRRADLPPALLALDLRHNRLRTLDPQIVAALPPDGRLWLDGNPLSCECDNADALAALVARRELVGDFLALRCPDGGPLRAPRCASPAPLLGAALAPLLLLAALPAAYLASRGGRARLKAALRRVGLLRPAPPGPEDDAESDAEAGESARPFDVFVSFSHHDQEAAEALVAGLEPRYRVCVHSRDWAPGAWIPAQIAASVRRSRRTLALVSARSLQSGWARAEVREALAARGARLLLVLLEEPARLALGAALRRHVRAHTYLRWGDAAFWPRLRAALPPPRAAPPQPPVLRVQPRDVAGAAA